MENGDAFGWGAPDRRLTDDDVAQIVAQTFDALDLSGKRLLLVVPDGTRTAPVGLLFKTIHAAATARGAQIDVMIALGTHPPMDDAAIRRRLEITEAERDGVYGAVRLRNHAWDDPEQLLSLGTIPTADIDALTGGLFAMDVPVTVNRAVTEYDRLVIVGPVFPHEVVGFSGGNKYLFPGISGPEILNFFHWLGAVITSPRIIGHAWTPVRKVVDRAASMIPTPRTAFCLSVKDGGLAGCFAGAPDAAWTAAVALSDQIHVQVVPKPFHTVVSCAPAMYDELWVGGKCMYKLEPVVADGGELIIYAPHIHEISVVHGARIERIGYHVRDYFLADWERFRDEPWGILAHSTHVRGVGQMVDGVERGRIAVTLATGISPEVCARIGLGYRDPATLDPAEYAGREDEGILLVPHAGEILYRLAEPPDWAR